MGWAKKNVPGYGAVSKAVIDPVSKPLEKAATQVFQPLEKAFVQPIGQGLASLDKMVGSSIPGGWGTVAAVAASMIPGGQFAAGGKLGALGLSKKAALGGLGALTGSGVLRKGGNFNLQGALMGGALAYGSASLADGLSGAAQGGVEAVEEVAKAGTQSALSGTGSALTGTGSGYVPSSFLSGTSLGAGVGQSAGALTPAANALSNVGEFVAPAFSGGVPSSFGSFSAAAAPAQFGLQSIAPAVGTSSIGLGNIAVQPGFFERAGNYISNIPSNIADKATGAFDALTTPSNYAEFADDYATNVSNIGKGAMNLATGAPGATAGFQAAGATLSNTAVPILAGLQGLAALDEQRAFLNQQLAEGRLAQAEYDSAVAEIDRQAGIARNAVSNSPFSTEPDRSVTVGDTLYGRGDAYNTLYDRGSQNATLYAMGGSVDDSYGMDEARGLGLGNLSNGFMNMGSTPAYAKGGMPRFLSGGGDGMSDDIPAVIGNKQPARLADGEFVIPADVVSHLGNGSSKAGAKQLYSMMDKVRSARTGNSKQGKQINPRKYIPA
jgi:hypothetical protein